jgi:hypothetical protein
VSEIKIESTVIKMSIGRTDKDEREESSGLCTKLTFDVVGSPRALARMANLLKQGNTNIKLVIVATNAATDVSVETVELPHQMGLGEVPERAHDQTANAAFPPIPDNPEPGATAIRTGEPIVTEAEANAEFDAMPSGNTSKPHPLEGLKIKQPKEGQTEFTVSLNGTKEKGELVPTILKVFCAKDSKELTDTLLSYEQSKNRDLLLEILQINQMPESVR